MIQNELFDLEIRVPRFHFTPHFTLRSYDVPPSPSVASLLSPRQPHAHKPILIKVRRQQHWKTNQSFTNFLSIALVGFMLIDTSKKCNEAQLISNYKTFFFANIFQNVNFSQHLPQTTEVKKIGSSIIILVGKVMSKVRLSRRAHHIITHDALSMSNTRNLTGVRIRRSLYESRASSMRFFSLPRVKYIRQDHTIYPYTDQWKNMTHSLIHHTHKLILFWM